MEGSNLMLLEQPQCRELFPKKVVQFYSSDFEHRDNCTTEIMKKRLSLRTDSDQNVMISCWKNVHGDSGGHYMDNIQGTTNIGKPQGFMRSKTFSTAPTKRLRLNLRRTASCKGSFSQHELTNNKMQRNISIDEKQNLIQLNAGHLRSRKHSRVYQEITDQGVSQRRSQKTVASRQKSCPEYRGNRIDVESAVKRQSAPLPYVAHTDDIIGQNFELYISDITDQVLQVFLSFYLL